MDTRRTRGQRGVAIKYKLRKLDMTDVLTASFNGREWLNRTIDAANDTSKQKRIDAQECQRCFYVGKMGGCAMTSSPCGLCEKDMMFGSTCVDRLCIECAVEHRLCKHCGGDIDMKQRRKI